VCVCVYDETAVGILTVVYGDDQFAEDASQL